MCPMLLGAARKDLSIGVPERREMGSYAGSWANAIELCPRGVGD
jgi:hypothetical protein